MTTYDDMRAKMIKQARREILTTLALQFSGQSMSFETVCSALLHLELPGEQPVMNDLTYLCERGYVRWTNERAMMPWKERMYKLTAKGKDFCDRIVSDPALEP